MTQLHMKVNEIKPDPASLVTEDATRNTLPVDIVSKENVICGIVIMGFTLSVIYHYFAAYIMGHNFYPYNTFLSPRDAKQR